MNAESMWRWAVLVAILGHVCTGNRPAYQVALLVQPHPKVPAMHICNGVVVHSQLVLTAASCFIQLLESEDVVAALPLKAIRIVAGKGDAFAEPPVFQVSGIDINQSFNLSTLENDLAVLHLSSPLPLAERDDIKWIILDDNQIDDSFSCLANYHSGNLIDDSIPDYAQMEELQILDPEECTSLSKLENVRKGDICTDYTLPTGIECQNLEAYLTLSGNRGTGLVCNSRLVAVLSSVLPTTEDTAESRCSVVPAKAIHTRIAPHLAWIYEIIAEEEYSNLLYENLTASSPYQHESGAIKESAIEEGAIDLKLSELLVDTADIPDRDVDFSGDFYLTNSGRRTLTIRSLIWTMLLFVVTNPITYFSV